MGLFDNIDNIENSNGLDNAFESIKKEICEYIDINYASWWNRPIPKKNLKIRFEDGKIIVDCLETVRVHNALLRTLQNDLFEWGEIHGGFYAEYCIYLENLKGAPKIVNGCFSCRACYPLKSLEGAPEKVCSFNCSYCKRLKNLEHISQNITYGLSCNECDELESFYGCPKEIGGPVEHSDCPKLKDLSHKPICNRKWN